jgi:hypothetical protein
MQIEVLKNGNLKMVADANDRKKIITIIRVYNDGYEGEAHFISEMLQNSLLSKYRQVKAEDVGALTDAPLIAQGEGKDMVVWGYMDYQVTSLLEELAIGNEVIWQKG